MIKNKISRYLLIVVAVLVLSTILPEFFWKVFEKPGAVTSIYFSPISKQYIYKVRENNKSTYTDQDNNELTRRQYEEQLPYIYYNDLDKWGVLPDSLDGYKLSISFIRHNSIRISVKPADLNMPVIDLYPLLESQSDYARLEYPDDLFRITDRMEFINADKNAVNEEKSQLFTSALEKEGFTFPAKNVFGNFTTRKPFDEGCFIVDASDQVFHLKMVKGQPKIVKTPIATDLDIRKIFIYEHPIREYYGLMLTQDNNLFLISYDNYDLINLPTENYDADKMRMYYSADPAYRSVNYNNGIDYYATTFDTSYQLINSDAVIGTPVEETSIGKTFQSIFPFILITNDSNSHFIKFNIDTNFPLGLISILISLSLLVFINIKKKTFFKENWADFLVVALTGIYGLIAVLLINPDVWD